MSRSTNLLKEIFTGTHLVAITSVTQGEGTDVIVRFGNGEGKYFDKCYDYTSSEFLKMCGEAGLLKGSKVFNSEDALGAKVWICVKEVWDVIGAEIQDTVNFYIFDVKACDNPEKKPVIKGDPADNKGVPSGVFYDTRQVALPLPRDFVEISKIIIPEMKGKFINNPEQDSFDLPNPKPQKAELPAEKKKVIEKAKEMIKKVESGSKTEVENNTPDEDWDSM